MDFARRSPLAALLSLAAATSGVFCGTAPTNELVDSGAGDEGATFTVTAEISDWIGTVGIVEWSVDREITGAAVEYGTTLEYGDEAPVDLSNPGFRTLILGMKSSREYHFRIRAWDAANTFTSGDYVLETGVVPNALPIINVEMTGAGEPSGGFITTSTLLDGWVFTFDSDGDCVWWCQSERKQGISRARMSADAERMMMLYTNNGGGEGAIEQVELDGSNHEVFDLVDATHDLAPIPGGITAYIGVTETCDSIVELNPDGTTRLVYDIGLFGDEECHTNAIRYSKSDDAYTVSILYQDTILKVDRESGALLWKLNGAESSFEGTDWDDQHGHQLLDGGILVFSNGAFAGSRAVEYNLDETNWQASLVWEYESDFASHLFGDVQRLPNGNTLVTYSFPGVIHEVSPDGQLVREIALDGNGSVGYAMWQESLYACQ